VFLHEGQVYAEDRIEELLHRDDPVLEDFFGGED
jgi:ABC-type transporter Mla maintaining outer membrane lipid asymmetry ATPase subunit MlaF